jgi:hypothetical protein
MIAGYDLFKVNTPPTAICLSRAIRAAELAHPDGSKRANLARSKAADEDGASSKIQAVLIDRPPSASSRQGQRYNRHDRPGEQMFDASI